MTVKTNLFRNADNVQTFAAGQTIFTEGQPGLTMYVVNQGEVELRIGDRVLETVGPGGMFGEMALIDSGSRSATATARTECQVVPVPRSQFEALIRETPGFALQVMRVMADRLRRTDQALARS